MAPTASMLWAPAPIVAATAIPPVQAHQTWGRSRQNYVNVVSFGFVASAILISMFLVMAIFERVLRPRPSSQPLVPLSEGDSAHFAMSAAMIPPPVKPEEHAGASQSAFGIPVLMPGEETPSYIARPTAVPSTPGSVSVAVSPGMGAAGCSSSSRWMGVSL